METGRQEERIDELLDAIIKVAQGDYSIQIKLSEENDNLDALAMGINMMVDDLRNKCETEKENVKINKLNKQLTIATEKAKESDRLKSAFLANMSHEIRTPMNGILGFTDLLRKPFLTDKDKNKYIDLIEKSGQRMLNIINELIDISKIESGQMDVFITKTNINEQLEYIYTFFKPEVESKGVQLIWHKNGTSENEATIMSDSEKLCAILTNLTKNAIKFTDNGTIEIGYKRKNCWFEFYVKDTGIGIPPEKQEMIFNRFVQVDHSYSSGYEGSGLGLAISRAYVKMLGGKMWVESIEEKGSTFHFTIPVNPKIDT